MSDSPVFQLFRSAVADKQCSAGETIFATGDPGDCMFAVQSGEVDLIIAGTVVETVSPGGIFGEMSLIENEPRVATAVAQSAASLVTIDRKQFEYMTRNTPNFAFNMLRLISRRLREMDRGVIAQG